MIFVISYFDKYSQEYNKEKWCKYGNQLTAVMKLYLLTVQIVLIIQSASGYVYTWRISHFIQYKSITSHVLVPHVYHIWYCCSGTSYIRIFPKPATIEQHYDWPNEAQIIEQIYIHPHLCIKSYKNYTPIFCRLHRDNFPGLFKPGQTSLDATANLETRPTNCLRVRVWSIYL